MRSARCLGMSDSAREDGGSLACWRPERCGELRGVLAGQVHYFDQLSRFKRGWRWYLQHFGNDPKCNPANASAVCSLPVASQSSEMQARRVTGA